ncbi:small subunit processome component 20 homolog [Paramacrobiotus metropolitanus]|uniref:small subunit processome component 20 homolog n=1 Tax=Paramacrobiotus metropolitanus TaxID=2943436 RepID=UPI0024456DBF|nr:small subunit processome component 20 homolog [Paramacrobiotus metropolitanus]
MKKPKKQAVRHKDKNTFKFKSFNERISEISVDARQNLFATAFEPVGEESFFFENYNKWLDLNRTQHFADFQKDVRNKINSYAMIVHHKDTIVAALLRHLAVENSLALEPLLDLTASLARDLQEDFYPYFGDFFRTLSDCVTESSDPEAIEWIFLCFSQMFKILRKPLSRDFENVFRLILPLFGNQKEYIIRFATESFAFLVRSYKDIRAILDFLLLHCLQNADLANGIGSLIFEVVKNVNHHLHSNFAKVLAFLVEILHDKRFYLIEPSEAITEGEQFSIAYPVECCVIRFTELLAGHVSKETWSSLWDAFWTAVLPCTSERCTYSLIILSGLIKAKHGHLIHCPEKTLQQFLVLCDNHTKWTSKDADLIASIASDLLLYPHLHLPVLERRKVALKVFRGPMTFEQKCAFAVSVIEDPLYESEILPHLLKLCLEYCRGDNLEIGLRTLIQLIIHKDSSQFEIETMDSWRPYYLDMTLAEVNSSNQSLSEKLNAFVMKAVGRAEEFQSTHPLRWSLLWSVAVLVPHFRPKLDDAIILAVQNKILDGFSCLSQEFLCNPRISIWVTTALAASLRSGIAMKCVAYDNANIQQTLSVLKKNGSDLEILYLTALALHYNPDQMTQELLNCLPVLKRNLRNPSHAVRLISLHILRALPLGHGISRVLDICVQAESIEVSVQQYREKLRFLRMLDKQQVLALPEISAADLDIPLLYLLGSLKIGFQLIWKEVKQLIGTYVPSFHDQIVWGVISSELEAVSLEAESPSQKLTADDEKMDLLSEEILDFLKIRSENDSHPLDAQKYRIQLWQCLTEVAEQIENRNRYFSELFQRFVRREFVPATLCYALLETASDLNEMQSTRKSRAFAEETVCTMLELFGNFRNPMAFFQEPVLRKYFLGLLTYRSPKIQALALKVLFRYKWEYLQPYEEPLNNLLDEKSIWNTLTEIEFGAANPVIAPEHRSAVVPIVIRMLFGRMQQKSKRRNTEKGAPKGRKEAIIRSLANCRPEEFELFLSFVLKPVAALLKYDTEVNVQKILKGETIAVNLKVLDGILQTMVAVIDEFRSVAAPHIRLVLKTVLSLLAVLVARKNRVEDSSDTVLAGGILRKLRKECYRCLCLICSVFPAIIFSDSEMKAFFNCAVLPEVDNTLRDGLSTCTPLMRLLSVWCCNQSYQSLMTIPIRTSNETALSVLICLLNPENNPKSVSVKLVVECLDGLLNPKVNPENELPVDADITVEAQKMVTPYVNEILQYFRGQLAGLNTTKAAKVSRKIIPFSDTELNVACAVSGLELLAAQAHLLLDVLLPFIAISQLKKEQDLLRLLEIVKRLVEKIEKESSNNVIQQIIPLLSRDFSSDCRTVICQTITVLSSRFHLEELRKFSRVATDLSAWNTRHIHEPDFDKRLAAYKAAKDELGVPDVRLDYALLVLHMAAFDIVKSNDIASATLRSMGGICITEILRIFSIRKDSGIILKHLLPIFKNSLKSTDEGVRNEFISIMSAVAQYFPEHSVFKTMQILRNADDPEMDVFDNLRHIQKHRVGRAFHRLSMLCQEETIPVSVILQYFFPLANVYLCNEQYAGEKMQGLINAIIALIEAVAGKVQWGKYETMVKFYLNLLVRKPLYQKQIIRVVVAVIDAFHFDMSSLDVGRSVGKTIAGSDAFLEETGIADLEEGVIRNVITEGDSTATKAKAGKIYRSLTQFILPNLSKLIIDKSEGDDRHKLTADVAANEKTELLRAPVALAMVKLLQKLPEKILSRHISGVFLRIAGLLKSRLLSVRQSARETLTEIMLSLGPSYLLPLIKELKGVLKRGYQVHVLVHCVHLVLTRLLPIIKVGDLDRCMEDLVQLCQDEMFGELSEENEVSALTRKIAEAKSVKSYDMYAILARFASPGVLVNLLKPIREKAEETQSHKVAVKLDKALREILFGLMNNAQLTESDLLLLGFALANPSMGLFGDNGKRSGKSNDTTVLSERVDSYLIPAEPKRSGPTPVSNKKSNDFLLQDFMLRLLLASFKSGRLKTGNDDHMQKLDPFVRIVKQCLDSKQVTVMTSALRCYIWMLKFQLPSLETEMSSIMKSLFVHLKNYSGPGAAVGENADLVIAIYKALSASVRDATSHTISDKHLKVLLSYAENDFRESSKQVLAFNVIRAILTRFLYTTELREMMVELSKMSIQSEQQNLRNQCRQLVFTFLSTYNARKIKLKEFVDLYEDNLEYPTEQGRLMSMGMLSDLFEKLGEGFKKDHSVPLFQLFAARFSDESAVCRQTAAECIANLLQAVDTENDLEQIFKWIRRWVVDTEISIKRIGLQACSLFVKKEKNGFVLRAPQILKELQDIMHAQAREARDHTEYDHLLINALSLLVTMEGECGEDFWSSEKILKSLDRLFFNDVVELLIHAHEWIRVRSLEAFNLLLQHSSPEHLKANPVFKENFDDKLQKLSSMLLYQIKSYSDRAEYFSAWASCMVYVLQAVDALPCLPESNQAVAKKDEDSDDENVLSSRKRVSVTFLAQKICREAVYEALHEPQKISKRLQVLKFIERLCGIFPRSKFMDILPFCLQVVYRCLHEPSAQKHEKLKELTQEVANAVENHVGKQIYAESMQTVISKSSKRRVERKRQQALEPVLNPEKHARKKIKKQQTKKEVRRKRTRDIELGRTVKRKKTKLTD